jgi:hypothetical protein
MRSKAEVAVFVEKSTEFSAIHVCRLPPLLRKTCELPCRTSVLHWRSTPFAGLRVLVAVGLWGAGPGLAAQRLGRFHPAAYLPGENRIYFQAAYFCFSRGAESSAAPYGDFRPLLEGIGSYWQYGAP